MDTFGLDKILIEYEIFNEDINSEKQLHAKQALIEFYEQILKLKVSKNYIAHHFHYSFMVPLMNAWRALNSKNYCLVCTEVSTLLHNEDISQPRILISLCDLLKAVTNEYEDTRAVNNNNPCANM